MARDKGENTKDIRFPLNTGAKPDGFSDTIPVQDCTNVVLLPDGSAMQPREGSEIRRRDEIGFGSDRKVIYFVADPPDIDYGDMICLVNTKDGRNDVQASEVVRTTVTRSDENPLPMPELPDTEPPAALNPVMLMIDSEVIGENEVYTAQAVFWNEESNSLTDTVDMSLGTGVTDDGNRFRTENYLCLCQGDGDVILSAYKLADIDPDQSNAPTITLTVYNDGSKTSFLKQVYPYTGDIVFILDDVGAGAYTPEGPHDYRLYKVDLATGTVSNTALTGLPEDMVGFCSGPWYGSSTVDANGDLWATGYSYGEKDYIIKINPATSVCTYLGTTSHNSSDQETGCFAGASGGVMCLPDDDYSIRKYDNALTTETIVSTGSMSVNTIYSNANSLLGNKTISWASSVGIFDFTTGVEATSLVFDAGAYPEVPPSVYDSDTFACMIYYYESGGSYWRLEFVDATTGEVTVGDGPRSLNGIMIQDAFAYGIKNIQGDRLS